MEIDQVGLDPDEPNTPTWFTFLGISLFLLGGIFFLLKSADDDESKAPEGGTQAEAGPAAADEAAEE